MPVPQRVAPEAEEEWNSLDQLQPCHAQPAPQQRSTMEQMPVRETATQRKKTVIIYSKPMRQE